MTAELYLPPEYKEQMTSLLHDKADAFFDSYTQKSTVGIRLNPSKVKKEELPFSLTNVPWAKNGYYVNEDAPLSRHPFYFAGCYYIQEPSAMLPAECLQVSPGEIVLDLCAAPGGKSTQLAEKLLGQGLLIANDVSASRANALLKNLTVWGAANSCISAQKSEDLLLKCGCSFDKILVDAPCSGEGMFRKDPSMIETWRKKSPADYITLQKKILSDAVKMLKPGGILAYSTCTFSLEENEEVVSAALDNFPELHLISPKTYEGFSPGIGKPPLDECIRLYPHLVKGEGHFVALMEKSKDADPKKARITPLETPDNITEKMPPEVSSFMSRLPKKFLNSYRYKKIKDQCLLVPPYIIPNLRYLRTGLLIGRLKSGRFEPSQDLAMMLSADDFDAVLDLDLKDPRVIRYLKGETIPLTQKEQSTLQASEEGWVLVCNCSHALGWGKVSGYNLKNKLYPGWRIR